MSLIYAGKEERVELIYGVGSTFQVALETLNNKVKALLQIDAQARPVYAPQVVEGSQTDFILMQQWAYKAEITS